MHLCRARNLVRSEERQAILPWAPVGVDEVDVGEALAAELGVFLGKVLVEAQEQAFDGDAVLWNDDALDRQGRFLALGVEREEPNQERTFHHLLAAVGFLPLDGDEAVRLFAGVTVENFREERLFTFHVGALAAGTAYIRQQHNAKGDRTSDDEKDEDESDERVHAGFMSFQKSRDDYGGNAGGWPAPAWNVI